MDVPIYIAELGDSYENGVSAVSLVDVPAILTKWEAFADKEFQSYSVNEEKQIIAGPAMIADLPIKRKDAFGAEYYIIYPANVIEDIVNKFALQHNYNNVNIMHSSSAQVMNISMVECFCIDRKRGLNPPKGFEQLTDGSWWLGYKVWDKTLFNACKETYKGFSVEGYFDLVPSGTADKKDLEDIVKQLTEIEEFLK